jgi:HPt (histidine-containing phosphotransfer) domain-containing protein
MNSGGSRSNVFDMEAAQTRIPGGIEALKKMAQLLMDECPKLLNEIREGLASTNAKQVLRGAHTLKSSADLFAAESVVIAARRLEELGRDGDLVAAVDVLAELEIEVAQLMEAVDAVTNPASPSV